MKKPSKFFEWKVYKNNNYYVELCKSNLYFIPSTISIVVQDYQNIKNKNLIDTFLEKNIYKWIKFTPKNEKSKQVTFHTKIKKKH